MKEEIFIIIMIVKIKHISDANNTQDSIKYFYCYHYYVIIQTITELYTQNY